MCTNRCCNGNRHCATIYLDWLFPSVTSDFTGTIADNPHYSTGTIWVFPSVPGVVLW